jgi:hypothetical protein
MKTRTKNILHISVIAITVALFMVAVRQGFAWTNPGAVPPNATASITSSGGNVGIGTTAPNTPFQLLKDTNCNGNTVEEACMGISVLSASGQTKLALGASNAGGYSYLQSMQDQTSWTNRYLVLQPRGGNVGIGTTAPAYKLDVAGDINLTGTLRQNGTAFSAGGQWTTSGTNIYNNNSGNVGIGTTSPVYPLHVSNAGNGNWLGLFNNGNTAVYFAHSGGYGAYIDAGSNATASTYALDVNKSGVPYLYVTGNGNVGIGTATPGEKLTVSGNVSATGNIYPNNQTTYGLKVNDGYFDTINTGVVNDPLELNFRLAGDIRFTGGDLTMAATRYVYPGSNSGLGDYQKSYYLASNASYGLYTNTSLYTAGGIYPQGYGFQGPMTTYGTLSLITPKNGYYGLLLGQTIANPNLMFDGAGNGGLYYENYGWSTYYLAGTRHMQINTSSDLGATLGVSGTGYFSGDVTTGGNLNFGTANPTISASSYFIAPGGAYFNSGTVYANAAIQARGGIADDTHSNLSILGGTSGGTAFSGDVSVARSLNVTNGIVGNGPMGVGVTGSGGTGVYGSGTTYGVEAHGGPIGVFGSGDTYGVQGAGGGTGVYGSGANYGVVGNGSTAVSGVGSITGVVGISTGIGGYGVYGKEMNGAGYGVYCDAPSNVNGCGGNRAWYNSSDRRLKENISTISDALSKVMGLRGVEYNWKSDAAKTKQIGFIAQESLPIVPEVVGKGPDGYYSMSYGSMTPLLVEAIKEQQKQIDQKQSTIDSLTKRVERLESVVK